MLNNTLLTSPSQSAGASSVPAGRFGDDSLDRDQAENDSGDFAALLQANAISEPAQTAFQETQLDHRISRPATVSETAEPDQKVINEEAEPFNPRANPSNPIALNLSSEFSLSLRRQNHLEDSIAELHEKPDQKGVRQPETNAAENYVADASLSLDQATAKLGSIQVAAPKSLRIGVADLAFDSLLLDEAAAPQPSVRVLLPTRANEIRTAADATSADSFAALPNDAFGARALEGFGEQVISETTREFRHPAEAVNYVATGSPAVSGSDWRSNFGGSAKLLEVGINAASVEGPADERPFQIVLFSKLTNQNFELRLDPPDLGPVLLRFYEDESGVQKATITSERSETLDLLRRHSDVLQRELERAGAGAIELGFQNSKSDDRFGDEFFAKRIPLIDPGPRRPADQQWSATPFIENGRIDRFA